MKHSKQHKAIRRRPFVQWYRRHRSFLKVCAIVLAVGLVALAAASWLNRAYAIDFRAVHRCIGTVKYLNQIRTVHLNVGECISNPYKIV